MAPGRGGRRAGPAFKPPSRVRRSDDEEDSSPSRPRAMQSRLGRAGKASTNASRSNAARSHAIDLSSTASEDSAGAEESGEERSSDAMDDVDEEREERRDRAEVAMSDVEGEQPEPAIPLRLLARLLHDGFEDKEMKISREAMEVYDKYMDTFVRETVARAAYEREDAKGDGLSDAFLQVEDLEKLAPQLLLDF